jgi:hypothetical protein
MSFQSQSLEMLLKDIHADGCVSLDEYQVLRDEADIRMGRVVEEFGEHNSLTALQKSMDVTMQLLQQSVLQAKKANLTDTGEAIVKDALTAQVEYLRAGSLLTLGLL